MIGLKRGTAQLVPHNPKWSELFEQEKQSLIDVFGDSIIAIEHIGSTAIPDIPAKPIIANDREKYTKSKEQFIKKTLEMASENYNHTPEV